MEPTFRLNTKDFDRAMELYVQSTKRDFAEIVNQRALNVAGRAFDLVNPSSGVGVEQKRGAIKRYLTEPIATAIARIKTGRNKGKFKKKGKKKNQLQRVHLIVQARRKREGKPGLYGQEMRREAAKLKRISQVSVGFLKSVFLPILTTLNAVARFKVPFSKTSNISRWPGSAGFGKVQIARPGSNPLAVLQAGVNTSGWNDAGAQAALNGAMQQAIDGEGREMREHVARKLAERIRRGSLVNVT